MTVQELATVVKAAEKALKSGNESEARRLLATIPPRHAPMVMRVLASFTRK